MTSLVCHERHCSLLVGIRCGLVSIRRFRSNNHDQLCFSQIGIWLIQWELRIFRQFPLTAVLSALLASTLSVFRTRAALQLEIIALRHQLGVLQRSVKRPKLNRFDRCLWAWLCGAWAEWRSALRIVNRHRVAPQRIPTVLDLESPPRPNRPPTGVAGSP